MKYDNISGYVSSVWAKSLENAIHMEKVCFSLNNPVSVSSNKSII